MTLFSYTDASPLLSQVNRLYPVHIIFQVMYHSDGVGDGRKEFSSKTITLDGVGMLMPLLPVSLNLRLLLLCSCCGLCSQGCPAASLRPQQSGSSAKLQPLSSVRLCHICGPSGAWGQGGDSLHPGKYCSPQTLATSGSRVCGPAQVRGHRDKSGHSSMAALVAFSQRK